MDILTIFKVIALAVFTVAAVFVMLAAATMWRTERAAAGRITRLVSADPAEASGDKERADRALLDVTEITRRVSEEPAEVEAEAEDGSAEISRLKEEVSFLNECREADSRRIQNLEERLDSLDDEYESCDDCDDDDDGAVPVSEIVRTLIVTAELPSRHCPCEERVRRGIQAGSTRRGGHLEPGGRLLEVARDGVPLREAGRGAGRRTA